MFTGCLSHKLELALKDAFKGKELDKKAKEQLSSEFYLFKKATLNWQLSKKYGKITGQEALRYKGGQGTRWVTYQLATIDVHTRNLATVLAITKEQIETPYNSTMKRRVATHVSLSNSNFSRNSLTF